MKVKVEYTLYRNALTRGRFAIDLTLFSDIKEDIVDQRVSVVSKAIYKYTSNVDMKEW